MIGGLRRDLGSSEAIAYFVHCYNGERNRSQASAAKSRKTLETKLEALERQIARGVQCIIQGRITEAEAERQLPSLRHQRDEVVGELASLGAAGQCREPTTGSGRRLHSAAGSPRDANKFRPSRRSFGGCPGDPRID